VVVDWVMSTAAEAAAILAEEASASAPPPETVDSRFSRLIDDVDFDCKRTSGRG
jgi:hypothetical protein